MPAAAAPTTHVINLPPLGPVGDEITGTAGMSRNDAVATLKALRQREYDHLARYQVDHLGEVTGLDIVLTISAQTDAIVRVLADRACAKVGAPPDWRNQFGLFAVGGYGRGEMNPYSDLDLMVLDLKPGIGDWTKRAYSELQALLWDVKFQVGAAHRNLPELERMIEDDFVTATAVVESRTLHAGDPLQTGMAEALARFRKRKGADFLRYKLEELAKRRQSAGASLFVMEPNLKSNPGCLRDVQLLRNIAFVACGSRNILALEELESITRRDLGRVLSTNDHLMKLRSLLHFHHKRKQDVFQLPDQVRVAEQLGYADVSHLRAVEHLMKHHYEQVWNVHQALELAVSRLHAKGFVGRKLLLIRTRKRIDEWFTAVQGQVYLSDNAFWRLPDAGARLITLCREAQVRGFRLSVELQCAIDLNLSVVDVGVRRDPAVARVFLQILGESGRVHPILYDMHAASLLGAYLPEFGNLTYHMQFDSYHQFTVDEHTLIAIRYLDDVANGKLPGLPGMARIFPTIARKDLLVLSLLLHDMGKYMGRGHVARGAIMVQPLAERLGLTREEEEFVHFLVLQHVALSDASRMRNVHEKSFLKPFAERIGDRTRLDALYCMTYCDARAVGEGILTGWQEALLGELYEAVRVEFDGGVHGSDHHAQALAELVAGGVAREAAERHLADLGFTYEHQLAPGEALRHWRVITDAQAGGIGIIHDLKDRFIHLTLSLPDRHALMADVAATLSGHGFDIIDLRTWVTARSFVVYTMRLSSIYPGRLDEASVWSRLKADLLAMSQQKLDAKALLDKRRGAIRTSRPADSGFEDHAVKVEQRTSDRHTIVDVVTKDEVGLLSRLCRSISTYDAEIGYACINTMGDVAVDVFYVSRGGAKLSDEDADGLRRHMIAQLGLA